MDKLSQLALSATQQAESAYDEAISARDTLDELIRALPTNDTELSERVERIQNAAVQSVSMLWQVKFATEQLADDLREIERRAKKPQKSVVNP